MKNIFVKIVCFSLATSLFVACQKEKLDPVSPVFVLEKDAFSTPSRILSQVYGLYDAAKTGNFLGSRLLTFSDIRGEEFLNRTNNGVTGLSTWNQTFFNGTNEVNYIWGAGYAAINRCNVFIEGLNANASVLNNATLAKQYEAEARFVRALCYMYLVNTYCRPYADGNGDKRGLPLRLKAEVDLANNDLAPSTVAQVYDQILADLNFAETNLVLTYGASAALLNTTRAHRNTAIALKTRVYLAMQRWNDVITEANKIVSTAAPFRTSTGVSHQLISDVRAVFASPYTTAESIFSFPMSDVDQPGTQNSMALYWAPSPVGNGEYTLNRVNGIISDSTNFRVEDARRRNFVTVSGGAPYLGGKFAVGPINTDYVPIIRYAEVLLNLSEAITRSTNTVDARALALLNAVHGRSDAGVVYTAANITTAADMITALLRERRIELLGEGFRAFDITRNLLTFPAKGGVAAVPPTSGVYVYPIPNTELATNKLMTP